MRTKSMVRTAVLLVLSLGLGIVMGCNQGNNTPQQQGNTPGGNTGGGTTQGSLDGLVVSSEDHYFYFVENVIYGVWFEDSSWKRRADGSYTQANTGTLGGETFTATVTSDYVKVSLEGGTILPIVKNQDLINMIKNATIVYE